MAKWEELPIADRAQYMRLAVQNGYRDIRTIREAYNKYAEGGNLYSDEENKTEPDYTPSPLLHPVDFVRRRLYDNLLPFGYDAPVERVLGAVVKNRQEKYSENNGVSEDTKEILDDIWGQYLNIPSNERHPKQYSRNRIVPSQNGNYQLDNIDPVLADIEEYLPYYTYRQKAKNTPLVQYTNAHNSLLKTGSIIQPDNNQVLGTYTLTRKLDPYRGEYIEYKDTWDINPYKKTKNDYGQEEPNFLTKYLQDKEDISMGIGTPVPIKGRIYLEDIYGLPEGSTIPQKEEYYGGILPELIISAPKLKSNGGELDLLAKPLSYKSPLPKVRKGIRLRDERGRRFRDYRDQEETYIEGVLPSVTVKKRRFDKGGQTNTSDYFSYTRIPDIRYEDGGKISTLPTGNIEYWDFSKPSNGNFATKVSDDFLTSFANDYAYRWEKEHGQKHPNIDNSKIINIKFKGNPDSKKVAGSYNVVSNEIKLWPGWYATPSEAHELSHALRATQGHNNIIAREWNIDSGTDNELNILKEAYPDIDVSSYGIFDNSRYRPNIERFSSNTELREMIAQDNNNIRGKQLDKLIDSLNDETLLYYYNKIENGYLPKIKDLKKWKKLAPKVKKALKEVALITSDYSDVNYV